MSRNNNKNKDLALELAFANDESQVVKILENYQLWDDEHWHSFDESSGNWSTIGNQQSNAVSALVEKIINSVDSVLMRECYLKGDDPQSTNAPHSVGEAQKEYFDIYNGSLTSTDSSQRSSLADNVYLVASGGKIPSLEIIDTGEGQSPEDFKNTFLSLNRGNKNKVNFVQGKFGMGGTGVLRYGSNNYQFNLIISRRNQDFYDSDKKWGVTLIRRFNATGNAKSSEYKYLCPNDEILSFDSDGLELLPTKEKSYSKILRHGAFIKLYDYKIDGKTASSRLSSDITRHLSNKLNLMLPDIALPIMLVDTRFDNNHKVLPGLSVRISEDSHNLIEDGFPSTGKLTIGGENISYKLVVFKRGKKATYAKDEGFILSVNGQTQGAIASRFFKKKNVGMSYLADSILMTIDCSGTNIRWQEDMFMNSRDRLNKDTDIYKELEEKLEVFIKSHPGLKQLREERRRELVNQELKDNKPLAEILGKVINNSPGLSKLLLTGIRIQNPFDTTGKKQEDKKFEGKENPTYFKLKKAFTEASPKICEKGRDCRIQFETDVTNDYFLRGRNPGQFNIQSSEGVKYSHSINLWNGIANLNLKIDEDLNIGQKLHFEISISDETLIDSLEENFWIEISELKEHKSGKGKRKKPPGEKDGKDRLTKSGLNIPEPTEIYKDKFDEEYTRYSSLHIKDNGDSKTKYDYFINMDNVYLLDELKNNAKTDPEIIKMRYKSGMMLIGLALMKEKKDKKDSDDVDIENYVREVTTSLAPILLPMVSGLGEVQAE